MKLSFKILAFFFVALAFASCGKKTLIDETCNFDNNCWLRFEPAEFKVPVNDTENSNIVTVTMRYDTSMLEGEALPLVVNFFIDSSELHNFTPAIRLRDKKGNLRGQSLGKYCIVTDTIDRIRTYNSKGLYTYQIKQGTSKYELYGVTSLNLKIVEN